MRENNPPPILDTASSFFLRHFMTVLSEVVDRRLPVTRVMAYVKEIGFTNAQLMIDVIDGAYNVYSTELTAYEAKLRKQSNGNTQV